MRAIDEYLTEIGGALHMGGAVRRRVLRECRDHLADAAAERGEDEAVRAFGPAAVPGRGSAVLLLTGPVLACVALVAVLHAPSLARKLDGAAALAVRPPLEDLRRLIRLPVPSVDARRLLLVTTCVAAAAAFLRDRIEHGTVAEAFAIAGIEGMAVVVCFFVLGPALGLWRR